jgi:hypothetical protein
MLFPQPSPLQGAVIAALVGLAGAFTTYGMAVELEINSVWIKASGPFAVFGVLFLLLLKVAAPDVYPDISSLLGGTSARSARLRQ